MSPSTAKNRSILSPLATMTRRPDGWNCTADTGSCAREGSAALASVKRTMLTLPSGSAPGPAVAASSTTKLSVLPPPDPRPCFDRRLDAVSDSVCCSSSREPSTSASASVSSVTVAHAICLVWKRSCKSCDSALADTVVSASPPLLLFPRFSFFKRFVADKLTSSVSSSSSCHAADSDGGCCVVVSPPCGRFTGRASAAATAAALAISCTTSFPKSSSSNCRSLAVFFAVTFFFDILSLMRVPAVCVGRSSSDDAISVGYRLCRMSSSARTRLTQRCTPPP